MAKRVVARILTRGRRYDGLSKVVPDGLVDERVPIVTTITGGPLTELQSRIPGLANACESAG